MKRLLFFSLRLRLIFLVLLAIIPALVITIYSGLELRRHARLDAFHKAVNLAKDISKSQQQLIESARHILFTLSQMPQIREQDGKESSKIFVHLLRETQGYVNFAAIKPNGDVFASAHPVANPTNLADRPFFKRIIKTKNFVIGEYLIGRITGKPTIILAYPVLDNMGHLKTVLTTGLDLEWLNPLLAKSDLPKGSSVTVIDSDGIVLLRYPSPEKYVGKSMSEASIVKTILSKREGVKEIVGLDGVSRFFSFTSLGKGVESIYVSVGIPQKIVFEETNWILARNLIFLGLIGILALGAAWLIGGLFVLQPVSRLLKVANRLAQGDLTARSELSYKHGEIGKLADSFDQMAESLELREEERNRGGKALRESEKRYRLLAENATDVIWTMDMNLQLTYISPSVTRIRGYSVEESMAQRLEEILTPTSFEVAMKTLSEEMEIEKRGKKDLSRFRTLELEEKCKDDSAIWTESTITFLRDTDGRPIGILGVTRDISERKRAVEEIRLLQTITFAISEAGDLHSALKIVLQKVCEATGWAMGEAWVPNSDGTSLECSPAWYSRGEGLEKLRKESGEMIFPPGIGLPGKVWASKKPAWVKDISLDPNFLRSKMTDEVGIRTAMAIPVPIGDEIIAVMDFFEFEFREEDERLLETISSVATQLGSLIQRKRAEHEKRVLEEQFRQSQKMESIGQLAGGVAHDFNNLLTIINGYSQLSLMGLKEGDPLRASLEEIRKAGERAAGLTRQLLAFSRRQVLEVKVVDLNAILKDLDKMLRRMIREDVELETHLTEDLGNVKVDPGQIEQVVMNLAVNARDAMPSGGKLTIETANVVLDEEYARRHVAVTPGRYVMLSVSDTGVGMTPEVKERIFEPFFTTKEKGKGTGLGLSTVYGIVKQSGGNIWVYSEPGRGTTFKIYLPRVDEPLEEIGKKVAKEEFPAGNETILLVEDDEEVRKLAVRILEKQGYEVLVAAQGNDALILSEKHDQPIHLMVTDVVMPGLNGQELANRLRVHHPEMRVLYMSGYTDDTITHHGILEKGMNYIQKPFTIEGLLRKVRRVLDK